METSGTFEAYHKIVDILQREYPFSINELKTLFLSSNKYSSAHDEIIFNAIRNLDLQANLYFIFLGYL